MKPTLLLVDDEPEILDMLSALFESEGFETLRAENVKTAWETYTKRPVDVVLSDHTMPGGSGLDLLKKIKSHLDRSSPAFFLMTGHVTDSVEDGSDPALSGVFTKPVDIDATVATIRHHLKARPPR